MARDYTQTESDKENFFKGKLQRRQFLQLAGVSAATATILSCKKDSLSDSTTTYVNTDNIVDFGSDVGLFNYIYALEQLEAAFYIQAAAVSGLTASQALFFNDIRLHEIAHREFYKNFLGASKIGQLEFDFSSIDFTTASSILATAKAFEDLGVAAYNGALVRAKETYTFTILSQIASVEARHAAYVRGQIVTESFADLTELEILGADATNGLDTLQTPSQVLAQSGKYIKTKLNIINL